MENNYLISIAGTMNSPDGDSDTVQLLTRGDFMHQNGQFFIMYNESEATGFEGSVTTVKVESKDTVRMIRAGKAHTELVIERGRRHVCHYESKVGSLSLGVAADEIDNNLTHNGGELTFSYMLDSGNSQISHNTVKITVQEKM